MTFTSPHLALIFLAIIGLVLVHARAIPPSEARLGFFEPQSLFTAEHDDSKSLILFTPPSSTQHRIYRRSLAPSPDPTPKREKNPISPSREDYQRMFEDSERDKPREFNDLPKSYEVPIDRGDPHAKILERWNEIAPKIGRANDWAVYTDKVVQESQEHIENLRKAIGIGRTGSGTDAGTATGTEGGSESPKIANGKSESETKVLSEETKPGIALRLKWYENVAETHKKKLVPNAEKAAEQARKARKKYTSKAIQLHDKLPPGHPARAVIKGALKDPLEGAMKV